MKVSIGNIIAVLAIVATLAGFYYTTNLRLDQLEADVAALSDDVEQAKKIARKARKARPNK